MWVTECFHHCVFLCIGVQTLAVCPVGQGSRWLQERDDEEFRNGNGEGDDSEGEKDKGKRGNGKEVRVLDDST